MTKLIEVELNKILNLVNCAEDFGWTQLLPDFAELTGWVTDGDIEAYIDEYIGHASGYTNEDRDNTRDKLHEWRGKCFGGKEKESESLVKK